MQQSDGESSDESVVEKPAPGHPAASPSSPDEPGQLNVEASRQDAAAVREREDPPAGVRRLEAELQRYREHAERTSKLFLSVTSYAEWVRESARRDAELILRKARTRVDRLEATTKELERTERELVRLQDDLERLRALRDETRDRLSGFLAAGLDVLNSDDAASKLALGDLEDTLHEQLSASTSPSEPAQPVEVEERAVAPKPPAVT